MFELHITSTKDIQNLKIEFTDGTVSSVSQVPTNTTKPRNIEDIVTSSSSKEHQTYSVRDLKIPDTKDRPIKVASELENLDI